MRQTDTRWRKGRERDVGRESVKTQINTKKDRNIAETDSCTQADMNKETGTGISVVQVFRTREIILFYRICPHSFPHLPVSRKNNNCRNTILPLQSEKKRIVLVATVEII